MRKIFHAVCWISFVRSSGRRHFPTGSQFRFLPDTLAGTPQAESHTCGQHPERTPQCRFQEIFHAIKTGRYPNRTKLAATIEVTTKTIQRDIDYMRYQMSVPIEFDYTRGGYYFTKPMTDLLLFQLTEAELVSVFVAQKALEAYKGTAFEQPLRTAFQKLQADRKRQCQRQLGRFRFRDFIPAFRRLFAGRDDFFRVSQSNPE